MSITKNRKDIRINDSIDSTDDDNNIKNFKIDENFNIYHNDEKVLHLSDIPESNSYDSKILSDLRDQFGDGDVRYMNVSDEDLYELEFKSGSLTIPNTNINILDEYESPFSNGINYNYFVNRDFDNIYVVVQKRPWYIRLIYCY